MEVISNYIGLAGGITVVIAYLLLSAGSITSHGLAYPVMNILGSVGLLVSLVWHFNIASVIVNTVWVIIGIFGLWRRRQMLKKAVEHTLLIDEAGDDRR